MEKNPFEVFDTPRKGASNPFEQFDAPPPSRAKEVAMDVARAVPGGVQKGVVGLLGLPGTIEDVTSALYRQTAGRLSTGIRTGGDSFAAPSYEQQQARMGSPGRLTASPAEIAPVVNNVIGKPYEPQTIPGQYAGTIAEFIPGMVLPGGTLWQRAMMAVAPAVVSETAGQATKGTAAEPYARLGGALAGGVAVAGGQMLARRAANNVLRDAAGPGLNRQAVDNAAALMDDAAARGVTLTWDEALNQVTGGAVNLQGMRRVVDNTPGGSGVMTPMMAQRPGQVQAAAGQAFDTIAPATTNPSAIGRAVGETAESAVDGVRQAINTATDPLYAQAASARLSPQDFSRVQAVPGWAEASQAIRSNPQLARYVQGMPDDSVGFVNEVKKYLDNAAENARGPMNAQRNQQVAAGYGSDATTVRQAAEAASPEYTQALATQRTMREQYLQPIMDSPLGKLANRDQTTRQAIEALFPANPLPGSAQEVQIAMTALARQRPAVASQLVRTHAEAVFNEAAQSLIGGANQFGGARFSAALRGNAQQAENLEAAVRALPRGDEVWTGFSRFLDIMDATGKRPAQGSATAFNQQTQEALKSGSLSGELANAVGTAGLKIPKRLSSWYEQLQVGKNSEELARILTNRDSVSLFRALAQENVRPSAAVGLATRLTYMGERALAERQAQPARP
jgi:hypothetical protein